MTQNNHSFKKSTLSKINRSCFVNWWTLHLWKYLNAMKLKEFCSKNLEFGGRSSLPGQQTTQPCLGLKDVEHFDYANRDHQKQTGTWKPKQNLIMQLLLWASNDLPLAWHRDSQPQLPNFHGYFFLMLWLGTSVVNFSFITRFVQK